MWQKLFFLSILFIALIVLGCNDVVAPPQGQSSIIHGETTLVENVDLGNGGGKVQILNQVEVFSDVSDNGELTGLRKVVINSTSQGSSYGTFRLEANGGIWEGDFTGSTTSSGTSIKAVGYDIDERGKSCEWNYYFPSSQDGKVGTFTAIISYERDEI